MTIPPALPENFSRTVTRLHGAAGREWLERLPELLAECAERWSLTLSPPFAGLSYNYAAPAVRADHEEVVLKAGFPGRELKTEIAALGCYRGRGCVRLHDADPERGLLLLERLWPGTSLLEVEDDPATAALIRVMRRLWRPPPARHDFPTVARWAAGLGRLRSRFGGRTGPLPERLMRTAETLFAELLDTSAEPVLLHGDLHHGNVLAAGREPWLAIDPKGVIGESAYEVGALLRNPLPRLLAAADPRGLLRRRVDRLAVELGFEHRRILGWGVAQAVLSACWCLEDNQDCWKEAIACAELLATLKA